MADSDRMAPVATPSRTTNDQGSGLDKKIMTSGMGATDDHRLGPARPDPETGDVRAGPGDAGLEDRPEVNAGSSGIRQMSNRRLALGFVVGAVLTVLVLIVRALF